MLWFVLFGIGMGFYLVGMPKNTDDYWYMNHLQNWFAGQGALYPETGGNVIKYGIPWNSIVEIWKDHFEEDNIRLGNLMAPFLLLGPKWPWSLLMLVMWFIALYMYGRFAGLDMKQSPLVVVLLAMPVFVMPWSEQFGSLVFQINYLAPSLLGAVLLKELFREEEAFDLPNLAGLFLLGFVTFWWQEGIGAPFAAGVVTLMLFYKRFRNRRSLVIVAGLLMGSLIMIYTPGMQEKTKAYLHVRVKYLDITGFIYVWLPWCVALVAGLSAGIKVGFRRLLRDPIVLFGVMSSLASLIIMLFTTNRLRAAWWYYLMACIYTVYFLRIGFAGFWSRYSVRNSPVVILLLIVSMVYSGSVGYVVLNMRADIERGFYEGLAYPDKNRFCRYSKISDLPVTSGYLPLIWKVYEDLYDLPLIWYKYGLPDVDHYNYARKDFLRGGIPELLRNVTENSGDYIEGNRCVKILDGCLFMKATDKDIRLFEENNQLFIVYRTRVGFGNGYGIAEIHGVLFRSAGDGELYVYLRPQFDWYVSHFKRLRHIDIM